MNGRIPEPASEIRVTKLQTLRGPNLWALRPVTRMDLSIGRFDDISSAQIPGLTERLMLSMPGLIEHRCSVGTRGGFLTRLRRGTYAAHIIEHVAIELQRLAGYEVGFGKARGGDEPGAYTLVFEHRHSAVGLRAAQMGLEVLQEGITGSLQTVEHRVAELRAIGADIDNPAIVDRVRCAITGGGPTHLLREWLVRSGLGAGDEIVDIAPAYILEAGLPFERADMAIILDATPRGVPERYAEPEQARRLVTVVSDVVPERGVVIAPAEEWEVQERILDGDRRLAVFSTGNVPERSRRVAFACAHISDGRLRVEVGGEYMDGGLVDRDIPPEVQLAAALGTRVVMDPTESTSHGR